MHREEQRRVRRRGENRGILPLPIDVIEDDWKR